MGTDTHNCTYCYRDKPGRFTKRQNAAGGGWSQPGNQPFWACYDCLPYGQGRGEETMPTKKLPITAKTVEATNKLVPVRREGLSLLKPLEEEAQQLTYTTEDDYQEASRLLVRVIAAQKVWDAKMQPVIGPYERIIAEAKEGMKEGARLGKEINGPLVKLEASIRQGMKDFKMAEQHQLQAAADERARESQRIQAEIDAANARLDAAKTKTQRDKVEAALQELVAAQVDVEAAIEEPIKAEDTGTRKAKKAVVETLNKFLKGIIDGYIPVECITIHQPAINRNYKDDPDAVECWPGVKIVDDITIVVG